MDQKLDPHLVGICSLVQKTISRFVAGRYQFVAGMVIDQELNPHLVDISSLVQKTIS